ncbi:MAG: DUF4406 domain-containing protein [Alistipes sp.]
MKTYISGQISGLPIGEVLTKFRAAENKLHKFSLTPVSPLNNGLPFEVEWADQMGRDIALLLKCEAIYMLTGWEQSEGATIEYLIARQRRMKIFHEQTIDALASVGNLLKPQKDEKAE